MAGTVKDYEALIESANRLGVDPLDYATVIAFETGGTMSPSVRGGAGNRHIGLIQFGKPEQKQFGAHQGQSFQEQLVSAENFLKTRGFKPGMGMMDLYSTINAGSPGRYNASDARNGGTPGTVADKVNNQMGGHRKTAEAFLGGSFTPKVASGGAPAPGAPVMQLPPEAGGGARSGRMGLMGVEASPNAAQPMVMPQQAPEAPDPGTSSADLIASLLAQAGRPAAAPAKQQFLQPMAPLPESPPLPFDAARFYALLNQRRV